MSILNRDDEQLLRSVMTDQMMVAAHLAKRLTQCGCTGTEARGLVKRAGDCGLLIRTNTGVPVWYRLNTAWTPPEGAAATPPKVAYASPESRGPTAIAYRGPVFDHEPLKPSLGVICSDAPPPEVARILDSLDRRFYEVFANVE